MNNSLYPKELSMSFASHITSGLSAVTNLFIFIVLAFWLLPDMNRASKKVIENTELLRDNRMAIEHNKAMLDENSKVMEHLLKDSHDLQKRLNDAKDKKDERQP